MSTTLALPATMRMASTVFSFPRAKQELPIQMTIFGFAIHPFLCVLPRSLLNLNFGTHEKGGGI